MRGYIVQRSKVKGTWSIKIYLGKDSITGKEQYKWFTVQGGRKDAEKRLTELLVQLDNDTYLKPNKVTISDFLTRWLEEYANPNLSPKTTEGYGYIINKHLIPAFGKLLLNKLKPEHLQKYYAEKQSGGLSGQTVRHHHTVMHKALKSAMEWELLNRNVADSISRPRVQRIEMSIWNEQEVYQFLEAAKATPYYALFYLALFTGMRRSEILALKWQDIDFVLGEVSVNRSLHVLKGGKVILRSPKTKTGKRTVALPPSAFLVLHEHRTTQESNSLMLGKLLNETEYVFSTLGRPLLPNTVSHAWFKLIKRIGIKSIRFHDARHTHASLMLKQGIHPKIVQERLGHSSISITLDTYSHVAPGLQKAAAKRFDELMGIKHNDVVREKV
jgi:integrase